MPIYEYECLECGIHFDKLQRFGGAQPDTCPNGHGQVHRLGGGDHLSKQTGLGLVFDVAHCQRADAEGAMRGELEVLRLLSQPSIIFKGSGFYVTDHGRSGNRKQSRNGNKSRETMPASKSTDKE